MFVDVLKRYLLIVWNFFFGQVSSESIQDSPSSPAKPEPVTDQADVNPSAEERSDGNDESDDDDDDDDDVEVVFDDEDREEDEDEGDAGEDDDDRVISPGKPEAEKVVPAAKPDQKTAVVKAPEELEVPEATKGEPKKPELPKTAGDDVGEPEKPKVAFEKTEKKDDDVRKSKPESVPVAPERKGDSPRPKPDSEAAERRAPVPVAPERAGDAPKPKPEPAEEVASPPPGAAADGVKAPERARAHVKFEDEKDGARIAPPKAPEPAAASAHPNARFVSSETGDANGPAAAANAAGGPRQQHPTAIDAFLSGEQRHAAAVQDPQRPESIQDQTLEYSDSGEELSDDDIEIDYEDDDDDDDDDEDVVEEVKPLPPVARTVYKKND